MDEDEDSVNGEDNNFVLGNENKSQGDYGGANESKANKSLTNHNVSICSLINESACRETSPSTVRLKSSLNNLLAGINPASSSE